MNATYQIDIDPAYNNRYKVHVYLWDPNSKSLQISGKHSTRCDTYWEARFVALCTKLMLDLRFIRPKKPQRKAETRYYK